MHLIRKYFPDLTETQIIQFSSLENLYNEWNARINVISRKDIEHLYERHILHSLAIAKVISFVPGTRILDAGTGGGFPGIPLAILFPYADFTLNDSIGKKIKVVNEISSSLGLHNVKTSNARAEQIKGKFDFIVSRAVTTFPEFYSWVKGKIQHMDKNSVSNGILYLKGGELTAELKEFSGGIKIYNLNQFFTEEFFETKKLIHFSEKNFKS